MRKLATLVLVLWASQAFAQTTLVPYSGLTVPVRVAISSTDTLTVAASDYLVCPLNSSVAATEILPSTPTKGLRFEIQDCNGNAATNNITISPTGSNIDGSSTFVMNRNYQSATVTFTGSQWSTNGSGGVASVGNVSADSSLSIFGTGSGPYTNAITLKLNTANANTWSAAQTFGTNDILISGITNGCAEWVSTVLTSTGSACGSGGGGGTVATGTANDLGYYATSGTTISPLASCNNGLITTNGSGVPSCGSTASIIGDVQQVTCNNNSGDAALVQAAVSTGLPVHVNSGTCSMTSGIPSVNPGQMIFGDGYDQTNFSGSGISTMFTCAISLTGPIFQDFSVSNVTTAFSCPSVAATKFFRVEVYDVSTGFALTGNTGQDYLLDVRCGATSVCVTMDGALDVVRIDGLHCFPFNSTTVSGATCIQAGRADGLVITNLLSSSFGTCLVFLSDATQITGSNNDCDTGNGINMAGGYVTLAATIFSQGTAGQYAVSQIGGRLELSGLQETISWSGSSSMPLFDISSGGQFTASNGHVNYGAQDENIVACVTSNTWVNLSNWIMEFTPSASYSYDKIEQLSGCRLTATGMRVSDRGTNSGGGAFIHITADDYNNVTGTAAPGWSMLSPGSPTLGIYYLNAPEFNNPRSN